MKYLNHFILTMAFLISVMAFGQADLYRDTFIRVYDLEGKKINKGTISSISENGLILNLRGETTEIPVSTIGIIKTKRSGGHNVATGAAIGAGALALAGVLDGDNEPGIFSLTAGEKGLLGLIAGGIVGSAVGGITIIFKKPETYRIDGLEINFSNFREDMKVAQPIVSRDGPF